MDAITFQREAMQLEKLMYHVSWSILRSNEDCADAVQEALTRAWQKKHTLRIMDTFKPWLMRILVNQCNDMLRRRKKRSFFPLDEAAQAVAAPEQPLELMDAIGQLSPEDYAAYAPILGTPAYLDAVKKAVFLDEMPEKSHVEA